MGRQVTKAGTNRYCQARLEAAKYNERFASRAGAAEELGCVTEDSLKKYELGITNPPNDVVALMADAYGAPELVLWYCAHECPLGKNFREMPEMPAERTVLRLSNKMSQLEAATKEIAEILDDGIVDDAERERIPELVKEFLETKQRLDEMLAKIESLTKN